jgi:hypothetical protein
LTRAWLGLLALAGCYNPDFAGTHYQCSSAKECPPGFHCAGDNTCWQDGTNPPPPDLTAMLDLTVAQDLTMSGNNDLADGAVADLPDLTPTSDMARVLPANEAFWDSNGAGTVVNGGQLAISIGGTSVAGTLTVSGMGSITLGNFANASIQ